MRIKYILPTLLAFLLSPGGPAFSHGVIESPPSRQQFCGVESKPDEIYKDKMTHEECRPIMTKEDGSLENSIYNFMAVLTHGTGRSTKPIDQLPRNVCGFNSEMWAGGRTPWDAAINWPTSVAHSGKGKFIWNISWGNHFSDTEEFVYWITKPDFKFETGKELTWNDFESLPFCKLNYNDKTPDSNPDVVADKATNRFITTCTIPQRSNRAVIYGEWGRSSSTFERFHSCMDVVFSTSQPDISAIIEPLPQKITGSGTLTLDGSKSLGSNLSYSWSISARDMSPYELQNPLSNKANLIFNNVQAQQNVTVNLTVTQGNESSRTTAQFVHVPADKSNWKMTGRATLDSVLKAGDKLRLRLIDKNGKDYFIPGTGLVLTAETAKPENWAYALAQAINPSNQFSAKIGVLNADNTSIEPVKSATANMIYVPVASLITNSYVHLEKADDPQTTCDAKRKQGSNSWWLGYDLYASRAPILLDFSATGIDLTKVIIDPGVFKDVKILNKHQLLIEKKPDWVSKTVPGYLGFYGPDYGSYDPFNSPAKTGCQLL